MKTLTLALISILTSSAAFAGPSYYCTAIHPQFEAAPIILTLDNEKSVQMSDLVDGEPSPADTLVQQDMEGTPRGYTRFYENTGCHTLDGSAPHCFAIGVSVMYVKTALFSGATQGKIILNSEALSCHLMID